MIIHEVGLRDGLQMEKQVIDFEKKIEWVRNLADSGVDIIQMGSFVHPKRLPQMADTDQLFEHFGKPENELKNTVLSGLVLNERGLERGINCGVEMFCMGVSASETHSKKNTGMTTGEATDRIIKMAIQAKDQESKKIQLSVQSAFGCGFEGKIADKKVFSILEKYFENNLHQISLADTSGHANPKQVQSLISGIKKINPKAEITCHFHNTYGMGLANCYVALQEGVKSLEAAFGGLGGCPFTKSPAGNVCTEDLVHMLNKFGIRKDINLNTLIEISKDSSEVLNKELPGFIYKSGPSKT